MPKPRARSPVDCCAALNDDDGKVFGASYEYFMLYMLIVLMIVLRIRNWTSYVGNTDTNNIVLFFLSLFLLQWEHNFRTSLYLAHGMQLYELSLCFGMYPPQLHAECKCCCSLSPERTSSSLKSGAASLFACVCVYYIYDDDIKRCSRRAENAQSELGGILQHRNAHSRCQ